MKIKIERGASVARCSSNPA